MRKIFVKEASALIIALLIISPIVTMANTIEEKDNLIDTSGLHNMEYQHDDTSNINNMILQRGSTLFYQRPYQPDEDWTFYTSATNLDYLCQDDFWDLTDPIGDIHWWGLSLFWDGSWHCCDPNDMEFEIIFYEDYGGAPGNIFTTYSDIIPTYTNTGLQYSDYDMYYFETYLDVYCDLSYGWISIQSTYSSNDCSFLWCGSPDGNLNALKNGEEINDNLAFWLTGGILLGASGGSKTDRNTPHQDKTTGKGRIGDEGSSIIDFDGDGNKDETWDKVYEASGKDWTRYHVTAVWNHDGTRTAKACKTTVNITGSSWKPRWEIDWDGDGNPDEIWEWEWDGAKKKWVLRKCGSINTWNDPDPIYDGDEVYFWGVFIDPRHLPIYLITWNFGDGSGPVFADYEFYANDTYLISSLTHSFDSAGTYLVTLSVKDIYDNVVINSFNVMVIVGENYQPSAPIITGQTSGETGIDYTYKFVSTDTNNDDVIYYVEWGDEDVDILGYSTAGIELSESHNWTSQGTYVIRAACQDSYGDTSDWTELEVSMPRVRNTLLPYSFLLRLLERFPNAFPILRQLLAL